MDAALPVLELQYVDETGTKGAITVKYPLGTTVAVMDAQASALASLIAPITGCVLIRQRIIYKAVQEPRSVPDTGARIHDAGVLFFSAGEDLPMGIVSVPGIVEGVISEVEPTAGYGIVLDNPGILALVDAILESGFTTIFGDLLVELVAGYRQSRT